MEQLLKLRKKFAKLEKFISEKENEKEKILHKLQDICFHPYIVEIHHIPHDGHSVPPKRACEVCGYHERGLAGYSLLGDSSKRLIRDISENEFYKYSDKPSNKIPALEVLSSLKD